MEERNKILAWVPHKSESETMVYGGDVYLKVWALEEELREEGLKQERKASSSLLPPSLPAFHSLWTVRRLDSWSHSGAF